MNLSALQRSVLEFLAIGGGAVDATDLVHAFDLSWSAVWRLGQTLVRAGLATTNPPRSSALTITDAGREAVGLAVPEHR